MMASEVEVIEPPRAADEPWRDRARAVIPRIAFVSGGMGGIGTAICRRFAQSGHTVVAGCLPDYERKSEWLAAMGGEGYRGDPAAGGVSELASCSERVFNE